jgi:uncharacterized protein (TIGR03435 family)
VLNAPAGTRAGITVRSGGRFEARGQTLADLARVAFGFETADPARGMVQAAADWMWNDRFDITATANHQWTTPPPGTAVPAELRPMLRALLEQRFALKAQVKTQRVDATALRLAKRGASDEPGLRPSTAVCQGPNSKASPGEAARPPCLLILTSERVQAEAVTMSEVAQLIGRIPQLARSMGLSLPIVDETNLRGLYDLSFSIPIVKEPVRAAAGQSEISGAPFPGGGGGGGRGFTPSTTAIIRAIETQLGLKLEPARVPVPTLVIERARKPKED